MSKKIKLTATLLVEDDRILRRVIASCLRDYSELVQEAQSGFEAWSFVQDRRFDLIITDYQMPEGDGFWLIERVRQANYSVPIILMSGAPELSREQALTRDIQGFLLKPFRPKELESVILNAIRAAP